MIKSFGKIIFLSLYLYGLIRACLALQKIAWGTGDWWGEYSLKWGVTYIIFICLCVLSFISLLILLTTPETLHPLFKKIVIFREKLGIFRWALVGALFIFPVWLFQYTPWGLVFKDIYLRVWLTSLMVVGLTILIKQGKEIFGWAEFIMTIVFTSAEFTIAQAFLNVTNYPFSLGWSEGNRMWDYSIMFGKNIYEYPIDQPIIVLLDIGRQFIGGLPFLIPNISIVMERFWIGLTVILPYLILGFALFRFAKRNLIIWILCAMLVLLFLKQGPIHPPLVVSAAVVALLWKSPLWLAIPLIAITGYFTEESRFTWLFAPGMWIAMLELADSKDENISYPTWTRAISLGLAGAFGGYFGDKIVGILQGNSGATAAISVMTVTSSVEVQPLLWYRLFPNATYGIGILAGLLIATLPLIIVIVYLIASKQIKFNIWQSLLIVGTLSAFFVVGIIVSTKIGGGGDLHNMDMFLIGLIFLSAIVWRRGGEEWFENFSQTPTLIKFMFILMFVIPGIQPLSSLRTYEYKGTLQWLFALTDTKTTKEIDLLPPENVVDDALKVIQDEITIAKQNGEVLFIDQRQLLTFGYIKDVAFVPEYEKKILMNEALSSSTLYFAPFYEDLANKRFSLIVSEPLRSPIKDSTYQFGEENNAWVTWVSTPILCYYEEKILLKEVGVHLLIPKDQPIDCASQLP